MSVLPELDPDETMPRTPRMRIFKPLATPSGLKPIHLSHMTSASIPSIPRIPTEELGAIKLEDIPVERLSTLQLPAIAVKGATKKNKKKNLVSLLIRAAVTALLMGLLRATVALAGSRYVNS